MRDIVFTRSSGWIPNVIREDGELKLMLGAGADANHEPRTFTFPIGQAHLAVIREDLARHLLLWSAVLPLCDAAGTRGRLDENAAVALLDPILLSSPADVDALFGTSVGTGAGSSPMGPTPVCSSAVRSARRCAWRRRGRTRNGLGSIKRTAVAPSAERSSGRWTLRF
ncbi:hypothetical protein Cci01nite_40000 [Catellatospora citrea]|uniref:CchlT n=1 Tax=Catellatospora citrea TaxID=53366 RepID=A0A8J3P0I9_9ACTN|nr:hypothetical protein C8E86_7068 [Catellatospora citrea]GIF98906.1 hypothetical protein Cci01nite_40000 [Catellatospora citrea]